MKTIVGYIVWDTDANTKASRPYTRRYDALQNAWSGLPRSLRRGVGVDKDVPPNGRAILPVYVDLPPRICTCGRPEDDHQVRHPFVPRQDPPVGCTCRRNGTTMGCPLHDGISRPRIA